MQSSVYHVKGGRLVHRETGEPIPANEPVYILRARSEDAEEVFNKLWGRCSDRARMDVIKAELARFKRWQKNNPDLVCEVV